MLLEQLGIYGWTDWDENLLLSSLLTGDPLLLIGNHGCAKTHVVQKLGQALNRKSLTYDASKCMFEDILGYPNIEKLKQGIVEYIPSPVTIWDKELVLIDELNRAIPELQSKWMEIIRSRKIMGFDTSVKWVFAAINPMHYSATNALDEALIGRFAYFLYPPTVLQMAEADRIKVALHINGDDAPSINEWTKNSTAGSIQKADVEATGNTLNALLQLAGERFIQLRDQLHTLPEFLARFAELLVNESKGKVALDGRRLGFLHRNILANRSIELAKSELLEVVLPDFTESARYVVQSSIPTSINDDSINHQESLHHMEICFDLLSSYFDNNAEIQKVNQIYELFTTQDVMRKAELLLKSNLGEMVLSKAWNDLLNESRDLTLLAYTALQIESHQPGVIPQELLVSLSAKVSADSLTIRTIPRLENEAIEYIESVESLLHQPDDLSRLVAFAVVRELIRSKVINPTRIAAIHDRIQQHIQCFRALLNNHQKGGIAA